MYPEALARELAHARGHAMELGARLESSEAQSRERLALLDKVKGEIREAFQASASAILEEKSQRFSEHNATHLGQLLTPLREQLEGFRRTVNEVYEKEGRERALLQKELEALRAFNLRIGDDALALTRALKGDSRTQGAFGASWCWNACWRFPDWARDASTAPRWHCATRMGAGHDRMCCGYCFRRR